MSCDLGGHVRFLCAIFAILHQAVLVMTWVFFLILLWLGCLGVVSCHCFRRGMHFHVFWLQIRRGFWVVFRIWCGTFFQFFQHRSCIVTLNLKVMYYYFSIASIHQLADCTLLNKLFHFECSCQWSQNITIIHAVGDWVPCENYRASSDERVIGRMFSTVQLYASSIKS